MQNTATRPRSLRALNALLNQAGLRTISKPELAVAQAVKGALDRIIGAAIKVATDPDEQSRLILQRAISWMATESMNQQRVQGTDTPAAPEPMGGVAPVATQSSASARTASQGSEQFRPTRQQPAGGTQDGSSGERHGSIETLMRGEAIIQTKVFGGRGAMQFEIVRPQHAKRSSIALMIEGAKGENKIYNWGSKIVLQCTPEEVLQLVAVLHGIVPKAKFDNHGPTNDKGFEIENQGKHYFTKIWNGEQGSMVAVPMPRAWAATLGLMVMSVAKRMFPSQSTRDILTSLARTLPQQG